MSPLQDCTKEVERTLEIVMKKEKVQNTAQKDGKKISQKTVKLS